MQIHGKMFRTSVLLKVAWSHVTRFDQNYTIQYKHLQITIAQCQNVRNVAFSLQESVKETQLQTKPTEVPGDRVQDRRGIGPALQKYCKLSIQDGCWGLVLDWVRTRLLIQEISRQAGRNKTVGQSAS